MLLTFGAYILWHKRRRRGQDYAEGFEDNKHGSLLEVDGEDSALTREQYDKRVAVELNGVITSQELDGRQSPVELDASRLQDENTRDARLTDSS